MKLRSRSHPTLPALALSLALALGAAAETLPPNHPSATVVKTYLENIVKQDWKASSEMLLPASLERKKAQMVEIVRNSRTMTEEATRLKLLGVKDLRALEKLSPQEAYIADRKAGHEMDERFKITPEVVKRKQETLRINILGLVPEEGGKIVHAVVRTRQETLDASIEELLVISVAQDKEDSKKWLVVPDMQVPITTPLKQPETPAAPAK